MSIVIKVENLSKQYRLGLVSSGSLGDDITRWWCKIRGKEDPLLKIGETNDRTKKGESNYVWSLKDINFEVKKGEILGIIGKNGAGKSTLLKILSKVTGPTTGSIKTKGKIASLLEVGTGFHPELTGKENIYLNGSILGMRKFEITERLDEIIDFAGIERYIDTPVKRYSSGMYVRLAFAVAAHLQPDILIVDEVLAVGDAEFQKKCIGKMKDVASEGRTVLLVSHNMASIKSICNRGILLEDGKIVKNGAVEDVISYYLNNNVVADGTFSVSREHILKIQEGLFTKASPTFEVQNVNVSNMKREGSTRYFSDEEIVLSTDIKLFDAISDLRVVFELVDEFNVCLLASQASDDEKYIDYQSTDQVTKGTHQFRCTIPRNILSEKKYFVTLGIINVKNEHYKIPKIISFDVNFAGFNGVMEGGLNYSFFHPKLNWDVKKTSIE